MKAILITSILFLCACGSNNEISLGLKKITYNQIEGDIVVLAADSLEGRAPFSEGERKTLRFLEQRMKAIGLEPAFGDSYFQEVPLVEIASSPSQKIAFLSKNRKFEMSNSEHFTLWSPTLDERVTIKDSELIFVGFGVVSPEWNWNDFEGMDLNGKTIVVLVNDPGFHSADTTIFNGRAMTYYGRWSYKFEEANRQGAAACIIVHEDEAAGYPWSVVNGRSGRTYFYLNNSSLKEKNCLLNGWITHSAAIELFNHCGLDYEVLKQKATIPGFKPVPMGAKYSVTVENTWKASNSYNVGGKITGRLRPDEVLVYTAHWDHLGIGESIGGDSIYNGASDNAAAVAWMLSIAEAFKALNKAPERSILFLSPTAEEAAMLGSQYYVDNPVFDHQKTVACFNSDVIMFLGRFLDVTVTGLGHSELDDFLAEEAALQGRYICNDPNPENGMFFRSDQLPFLKAGVPSLFAKGYSHQEKLGREETLKIVDEYWRSTYHKPSDEYIPDIHRLDGLVDDAKLFFQLGYRLANSDYFPKWKKESEFYTNR